MKNNAIYNSNEKGLAKLQETSYSRHKFRDAKYKNIIDRISSHLKCNHLKINLWLALTVLSQLTVKLAEFSHPLTYSVPLRNRPSHSTSDATHEACTSPIRPHISS